jgi:hypothetical protein
MSKKLQNIKAIRQMLDGVHRTQSKTTVTFSDVVMDDKNSKKREIGETWIDEAGTEWEQRSGFRIRKGKLNEVRNLILSELQVPDACPKCNNPMTKRLDKKFWKLEKHCFDCQIAYEHQLRLDGKYEEYEKSRIRKNAEAWLSDAEQEALEIANVFRNPLTFANADGTYEKWSGGATPEEIASKIENEFRLFKENFLSKLE